VKPAATVTAPSAPAAASSAAAAAVPPKVSPKPLLQKQSKLFAFVTVPVVNNILLLQLL